MGQLFYETTMQVAAASELSDFILVHVQRDGRLERSVRIPAPMRAEQITAILDDINLVGDLRNDRYQFIPADRQLAAGEICTLLLPSIEEGKIPFNNMAYHRNLQVRPSSMKACFSKLCCTQRLCGTTPKPARELMAFNVCSAALGSDMVLGFSQNAGILQTRLAPGICKINALQHTLASL